MFLSAVRKTSKPTRSASKSPLESVSHPRCFALMRVCPRRNRAMPRGVPWSNRMSINGGLCSGDSGRGSIKATGGKFQHRVDLLARDIELLDDFLYGGSGFEVQEHGGYGHTGIAKYPGAT